jgi:oligoribonuclease (3'-5' exoribonuclease)
MNTEKHGGYVFLDCEMGGLEKEIHSLLSVYLLFVDDDFQPIDDLYLYLKPNDGNYVVCAQAMNVNKIDLVVHDTKAITYREGGTKLYQFLKAISNDGKIKVVPVGHGIYGDIEWIIHNLIGLDTWNNFVSYRKIDTQAISQFLKTCGKFPEDVSGSLKSIADYFGIAHVENELHTAKGDTLLTLEVFKALRNSIMGEPTPAFYND